MPKATCTKCSGGRKTREHSYQGRALQRVLRKDAPETARVVDGRTVRVKYVTKMEMTAAGRAMAASPDFAKLMRWECRRMAEHKPQPSEMEATALHYSSIAMALCGFNASFDMETRWIP